MSIFFSFPLLFFFVFVFIFLSVLNLILNFFYVFTPCPILICFCISFYFFNIFSIFYTFAHLLLAITFAGVLCYCRRKTYFFEIQLSESDYFYFNTSAIAFTFDGDVNGDGGFPIFI